MEEEAEELGEEEDAHEGGGLGEGGEEDEEGNNGADEVEVEEVEEGKEAVREFEAEDERGEVVEAGFSGVGANFG